MNNKLRHLRIDGPNEIGHYTTTITGRGKGNPNRERESHGNNLVNKLKEVWVENDKELLAIHSERNGVYIDFISSPDFEIVLKSLENLRANIRLCNVRIEKNDKDEEIQYATVYVPNNKREFFFTKIENYLTKQTAKGNPHNANLIDSINDLRRALLVESFWQDDKKLIPTDQEWCEVWLRNTDDSTLANFDELLVSLEIESKVNVLFFPERIVKLVYVDSEQLASITKFSDSVAEYRKAKTTATVFTQMDNKHQTEWVVDILDRLEINEDSNVSVCILDTGVNSGHSLLSPVINTEDCSAVDSDWGSDDHSGHGTLMAGVVTYGNLKKELEHTDTVNLNHRLESIKILPKRGKNDPELWGDITSQAISIAEINNPETNRITCMAITSDDDRDRGKPSSWSGALDNIIYEESNKKIMLISVGNVTNFEQMANYPECQLTDSIHDPAQSWNSISVGALTELDLLTDEDFSDFTPVASKNQLSPFSTTSYLWSEKWPIKPEVVFEGGNIAVDSSGFHSECDDLSLLSTHYKPQERQFETFNMTSSATALAANFTANLQAEYPQYWPETIRALLIHSADWPKELFSQFTNNDSKTEIKNLLKMCGYGLPSFEKAVYCNNNSLTLVSESEIQPYEHHQGRVRTKDIHFYELPWPTEVLESLNNTIVEMRITLSYFIEPSPGEVGWKDKYRYPSHSLRFHLNSPLEDKSDFLQRINKEERDEDIDSVTTSSPSAHWVIGQERNKGSIHSDTWRGTATELSASNLIAVCPGIGWWKTRKHLDKYSTKTRYSLIVTIKTPELEVDIYTPVKVKIDNKVRIPIT